MDQRDNQSGTPTQHGLRQNSRKLLIFIGLSFVICNLLISPWMEWVDWFDRAIDQQDVIVFVMIGMIMAQFALAALWMVFAPRPFYYRIVVGLCAILALFVCWCVGHHFGSNRFRSFEIINSALCVPAICFVIQCPMWIAKLFLRWRIQLKPDEDLYNRLSEKTYREGPTTITHWIVGTSLIAACIGAARSAVTDELMGSDFARGFQVVIVFAATIGVTMTVPSLFLLRANSIESGTMLLGTFYFVVSLPALEVTYPGQTATHNLIALLSFAFWLVLPITAIHKNGYRLVWGREKQLDGEPAPNSEPAN